MSNPSNVLSDFETYSYHHVLLATDGASTVAALREVTDLDVFRRPYVQGNSIAPTTVTAETYFDDFIPRQISTTQGTGQYVILIDTMTDSRFAIESVKWETIVAPQGGNNSTMRYGNTIEVEGEIIVQEPYGMDLYKVLANAARDLDRSPATIVYVLKTIFVGRHSDGTVETISSVRPFNFVLTDVTSVIDNRGTQYKLEIVGMDNGVSKIPQHALAAQGVSIDVEKGKTVGDAVASFEQALEKEYSKHFNTTIDELVNASGGNLSKQDVLRKFQRVRYTFEVDPAYTRPPYTIGDQANISTTGEGGAITIGTGPKGTIENMLHKIMSACKRVDDDSRAANEEDKYYIYKIVSTLREGADGAQVIHHAIRRYHMVQQDQNGELLEPKPGEFIEFDYIYTGRNVDVLEFDIKMDMGLSFFLTLATAPNLPRTGEEYLTGIPQNEIITSPDVGSASKATNSSTDRADLKVPLYMSSDIDDPFIRNKVDSLSAASYEQLLSRHVALESVESAIKIAGNPNLLDELIETTGESNDEATEGNTGAVNITRTPALVKVNVKFPTSNELAGVKDFWYRGFYNIYAITQNFEGGLFTQDIQMLALPRTTSDGPHRNSSNPPARGEPRPPSARITPPTTAPCTRSPYDYNLIHGFTGSPADNGNFILRVEEIAQELGTLPEWMIALMAFETAYTFDPSTTNSIGFTGLIQFSPATAQAVGTTTAELRAMTAVEQLYYVREYFIDQINQGKTLFNLESLYTAVLTGNAQDQPGDILETLGGAQFANNSIQYQQNPAVDVDGDGTSFVGEATTAVAVGMLPPGRYRDLLIASDSVSEANKARLRNSSASPNAAYLDATLEYQQANGLVATGYVNDQTIRHIAKIEQPRTDGCETYDRANDPTYPFNQRNNNPTNIKKTTPPTGWEGEIPSGNQFVQFTTPQFGLRAAYILLRRTYFQRDGLKSVEQIINKWAPQETNLPGSTSNYVTYVSDGLGVSPREPLNIDSDDQQLMDMARLMAEWEGGTLFEPYEDSVYTEALALYPR